ncbi:MAG: MATE family efflux transporter [Lachnospiraceae bacterium]|nr:MATE family efflux transporter [Lachnospiraceae bacterium]
MDQTFMKTKKVLPLVMSMAVPMVVSMLVNALYNIVDSFFIAKISEDAMTAISLVFPLHNAAGAVSIGFGVGANAVTAFFLGERNQESADGAASLSLLLSMIHSLVLTISILAIMGPFLRSFTDSQSVLAYGMQYGSIVFGCLFLGQIGLIYEKLFQAIGSVRITMFSMMAGCITNIILDPVMIFGLGPCPAMGIQGAAVATVIGQAVTLGCYLIAWAKGLLYLQLSLAKGWRYRRLAGRLYRIGVPAILNQALPSLLITILNSILAAFSQTDVLILGVYYKLQTFIYLTANGIVQGIRPLVAYNYGAGMLRRVREIFRTALCAALLVMSVGTVLCLLIPQNLIGMFSSNTDTVIAGVLALRIICAGFMVSAVSVVVCGTMEGLGFGGMSFIISSMRYAAVILPLAWILSRLFGVAGVWHAFWIAEFVTAVVSAVLYYWILGKISKRSEEK